MSGELTPSRGSGALRASDAERQATAELLGRHFVSGRLSVDEYSERAGLAYAARTRGELQELLVDLPAERPEPPAPRRPPAPVAPPVLFFAGLWLLMGASAAVHAPLVLLILPLLWARRAGRWRATGQA